MTNLFNELKRRNVFRVGAAYLVVGWLVIEVIDTIAPRLGLPDWFPTAVILLVLAGLPLALIFSWAFELTPEGLKRTDEAAADVTAAPRKVRTRDYIAAAVAILVFSYFITQRQALVERFFEAFTSVPSNGEIPAIAEADKSVAVLPFTDLSEAGDQEWFSDGLSEEILNVLAKLPELKVAGRTSSFQFRDRSVDLRDVGDALGVANILEGSVRRQGNRVRITAQLIRSSDGFHLWSDAYDRNLEDIFAVQEEIAAAIAKELAIRLDVKGGQLVSARTTNMAAYDKYLEARILLARRENFPSILALLGDATQMDPNFAPAWGLLAQADALGFYYLGQSIDRSWLARAVEAANRALALDPNLATAHSAKADALRDQFRWLEAEDSYLRALAIDPDHIEANSQYSQMLLRAGMLDKAYPYAERAAKLDPTSWLYNSVLGVALSYRGEIEKGRSYLNRASDQIGQFFGIFFSVRLAFLLQFGNRDDVVAEIQSVRNSGSYQDDIGDREVLDGLLAALAAGDGEALAWIKRNYASNPKDTGRLVMLAAYLGDPSLADEILGWRAEVTARDHVPFDLIVAWLDFLGPVRKTEGFKNIVRTQALDDYWRARGFPPRCRPRGDDDFECD